MLSLFLLRWYTCCKSAQNKVYASGVCHSVLRNMCILNLKYMFSVCIFVIPSVGFVRKMAYTNRNVGVRWKSCLNRMKIDPYPNPLLVNGTLYILTRQGISSPRGTRYIIVIAKGHLGGKLYITCFVQYTPLNIYAALLFCCAWRWYSCINISVHLFHLCSHIDGLVQDHSNSLLTHLSYCSLALSLRYVGRFFKCHQNYYLTIVSKSALV